MIAKDRGRAAFRLSYFLLLFVIAPACPVRAQQDPAAAYPVAPPAPGGTAPGAKVAPRHGSLE